MNWTFTADDVLRLVVAVGALVLLAYLASVFHRRILFEDALRAVLGLGAMLVVAYLAIAGHNDQAAGALLLLLGQAGSWLFRGKLFQSDPGSPPPASPPLAPVSAVWPPANAVVTSGTTAATATVAGVPTT